MDDFRGGLAADGEMQLVLDRGEKLFGDFLVRVIIDAALAINIGDFLVKPAFAGAVETEFHGKEPEIGHGRRSGQPAGGPGDTQAAEIILSRPAALVAREADIRFFSLLGMFWGFKSLAEKVSWKSHEEKVSALAQIDQAIADLSGYLNYSPRISGISSTGNMGPAAHAATHKLIDQASEKVNITNNPRIKEIIHKAAGLKVRLPDALALPGAVQEVNVGEVVTTSEIVWVNAQSRAPPYAPEGHADTVDELTLDRDVRKCVNGTKRVIYLIAPALDIISDLSILKILLEEAVEVAAKERIVANCQAWTEPAAKTAHAFAQQQMSRMLGGLGISIDDFIFAQIQTALRQGARDVVPGKNVEIAGIRISNQELRALPKITGRHDAGGHDTLRINARWLGAGKLAAVIDVNPRCILHLTNLYQQAPDIADAIIFGVFPAHEIRSFHSYPFLAADVNFGLNFG